MFGRYRLGSAVSVGRIAAMNNMILSCLLLSQLLPAAAAQVDSLPGSAFSIPAKGLSLRSDAGQDFAEVLSLDGQTTVRIGAVKGVYREVFVPQGFAVYMHGDYLQIDRAQGTATVTGDRVNMRLLPSRDGLPPVGTLSRPSGPLVVLEETGEWVRVLAPVVVPLFAPQEQVPATSDAGAGDRWRTLYATRDARRQATVASLTRADPEFQRESELLGRVEAMAQVDVTTLTPTAMAERRAQLDQIAGEAKWTQTQSAVESLRRELDTVRTLRATSEASVAKVAQAQTSPDAMLIRESRLLLLGFRYKGKGTPVSREGVVQADGPAAAPVYTLRAPDGEVLKLTVPAEVAKLAELSGKRVQIDGRRLFLALVDGPVLVIDRVTVAGTPSTN
jgi:hypothetical protein